MLVEPVTMAIQTRTLILVIQMMGALATNVIWTAMQDSVSRKIMMALFAVTVANAAKMILTNAYAMVDSVHK
jgi:hypothetical protein